MKLSKTYNVLVLTDHTNHSSENSLYPLLQAMRAHSFCESIDVATRGNFLNNSFFNESPDSQLWGNEVTKKFAFSPQGKAFSKEIKLIDVADYDLIWLRMPPPLSKSFLDFLDEEFPDTFIINDPKGIYETGNKGFLMNFEKICPPMKICNSLEDIIEFKANFPIVLKPFREYGGRGIVKIDGNRVWEGNIETTFEAFAAKIGASPIEYLAVKFLKNVGKGDKRIIVVNGKIMGASLRLPAENSWLCNVAMGGRSAFAEADEAEIEMIRAVDPVLSKRGIVMYGVDTLVGDDGKRVLSELNTTSIGGLPQIAKLTGQPLVKEAIDLIWKYYKKNAKA